MAAMDQTKLDALCTKLNGEASTYLTDIKTSLSQLIDTFNANWVSVSSKELANEIGNCVNNLTTNITTIFSEQNDAIKDNVYNFNLIEQESISYSGFAFAKPDTTIELAATLPNGKVGVADNADLTTIETCVNNLISNISAILGNVKSAVRDADAFGDVEQQALTAMVDRILVSFENDMGELKSSLATRMADEISIRDELNKTNSENFGGNIATM